MTTQGSKSKITKAVWHKSLVHSFCDVCIRAIGKHFRPGTHFNKQGWEFIINEFRKDTGFSYDQKQLKNKWDSMKKEYKLWKDLIRNETGLGWDPRKNTVDADDVWWDEKIKENPRFETFKVSGIEPELESKYELMFFNIIATGEFAMSPGCNVNVTVPQEQAGSEGGDDSSYEVPLQETIDEMFAGGTSQPKRKRDEVRGVNQSSISYKKGKKQLTGSALMAKHLETLVGAVAARSPTPASRVNEPVVPYMEPVLDDLSTIPGLDIHGDIFMFATEFLEDKIKREVYLGLKSSEQKLRWLTYHFTHKGPSKNV